MQAGNTFFARDAFASPPWGETDRFAEATHDAPASPPWGETDRFAGATHNAPASQQQRNNLFRGASELTIATRSRSRAVQHYPVLIWRFAGNNAVFEGSSGAFSRSLTPFLGCFRVDAKQTEQFKTYTIEILNHFFKKSLTFYRTLSFNELSKGISSFW